MHRPHELKRLQRSPRALQQGRQRAHPVRPQHVAAQIQVLYAVHPGTRPSASPSTSASTAGSPLLRLPRDSPSVLRAAGSPARQRRRQRRRAVTPDG